MQEEKLIKDKDKDKDKEEQFKNKEEQFKNKQIKKLSLFGIGINVFLLLIKIIGGVMFKSQSMIADGINSASDVFNCVMAYIGNRIASKPSDRDHQFGHGKAEYIFSLIISLVMIVIGLNVCFDSIKGIIVIEKTEFSYLLLVIILISIIFKLLVYLYANKIYKTNKSILVLSNKIDSRNDIFITLSVLISVILSYFNIHYVDSIIAIGISGWIIYLGIEILKNSYDILMDKSIDFDMQENIKNMVESYEEVIHIDDLKARPVGNSYVLSLKISMKGELSLKYTHDLSGKIKDKIKSEYKDIKDVIIHINPH